MKKSYKIEVDCANCAQKMEDAANTVAGVANATVSFMTQKMKVEFSEGDIFPRPGEVFPQRERPWQRDEVCVDCQGLSLWESCHEVTERVRPLPFV